MEVQDLESKLRKVHIDLINAEIEFESSGTVDAMKKFCDLYLERKRIKAEISQKRYEKFLEENQ